MDYRQEIVNMSKRFPNLRFGQFIANAIGNECDLFNMTDKQLYDKCKEFCNFYNVY